MKNKLNNPTAGSVIKAFMADNGYDNPIKPGSMTLEDLYAQKKIIVAAIETYNKNDYNHFSADSLKEDLKKLNKIIKQKEKKPPHTQEKCAVDG